MPPKPTPPTYTTVLDFWFGPPSSTAYLQQKPFWYGDKTSDAMVQKHLGPLYETASSTATLDRWQDEGQDGEGALALILLLDQVPRNIFRGTPRAYATDEKAREVARRAVLDKGLGRGLPGAMRRYLYSPFNHSEDRRDQEISVSLFTELGDPTHLFWARRFCEDVKRDGRFVHRDGILGR